MSATQGAPGEALDPVTFLRSVHPFDQLSAQAFRRASQALEIAYYPAGEKLLTIGGQPSQALYVIRKGAVRLVREGETLAHLEVRDVFGYPSILSGQVAFEAIVDEDLLAYLLPKEVFRSLLSEPSFGRFFTLALADRIRITLEKRPNSAFDVDFHLPVERLAQRPLVSTPPETPVREAALRMQREGVSSLIVEGEVPGILTDRDLRSRIVAEGRSGDTPVGQVASFPLRTIDGAAPVYDAWMTMIDFGVKHLPLTRDGRVFGMITETDLLRNQTHGPLFSLRRVRKLPGRGALGGHSDDLARLAGVLLEAGLEAIQIARLVSRINDVLLGRILDWAREDLGDPPQPYTWIVFGSEGRYEQTLSTDQDNALIWEDDTAEARDYFGKFARSAVTDLIAAGFPECPGGFMATRWLGPVEEWKERFAGWIETPDPKALLNAAIFFDFRAVAGGLALEEISEILSTAPAHAPFLARLAEAALAFRPPLTLFRQLKEEDGGVNVKRGGLAPISGLARAYGLESGSRSTNTLDRLSAASDASLLASEDAETLAQAYRFLLSLRLREQIRAMRDGRPPGNQVPLESLSGLERRELKEVFQAVNQAQTGAVWHFHTAEL